MNNCLPLHDRLLDSIIGFRLDETILMNTKDRAWKPNFKI